MKKNTIYKVAAAAAVVSAISFGVTAAIKTKSTTSTEGKTTEGVYLNQYLEGSSDKTDPNCTLVTEAYVTGATQTVATTKNTNTVLVIDCSGSMVDPLTSGATILASRSKGQTSFDASNLDQTKPESYYSAVKTGGLFEGSRSVYYTNCRKGLWVRGYADGWGYLHETEQVYCLLTATDIGFNYSFDIYKSKLGASMDAAIAFTRALEKAGGTHLVSVVGFPSSAGSTTGATTKCTQLNACSSDSTAIINAIYSLFADGATPADDGLTAAKNLMKADTASFVNNIVFMTDGEPTNGSSFSSTVANKAISAANECKTKYKANVFSIGIFNDGDQSDNAVAFMDRVSSDYEDATTYQNGTKVSSDFYSIANSNAAINTVLQKISEVVKKGGAAVQLTKSTTISQTISGDFELPEGFDISKVKVYTAEYDGTVSGVDQFKDPVEMTGATIVYNEAAKTIKVSNFDFSENWCGDDSGTNHGKKLIIKIPVKLSTDCGGDDMDVDDDVTITDGSGDIVSELGDPDKPSVDLPNLTLGIKGLTNGETLTFEVKNKDTGTIEGYLICTGDGTESYACSTIVALQKGSYTITPSAWNKSKLDGAFDLNNAFDLTITDKSLTIYGTVGEAVSNMGSSSVSNNMQ